MNKKICFELTVQSLARILAQIKPTPWEKVSLEIEMIHFCVSRNQCEFVS